MLRRAFMITLLAVTVAPPAASQSLRTRIDRLLDAPPFDRASWGVVLTDSAGRVLYARNADRLFIPASNTKLVVTATASGMLPSDFRLETVVYAGGPVDAGTLHGDLIVYGGGDPTFSERCYGPDTLALGACDRAWSRLATLADSVYAHGIRHVTGALVGDGSVFDAQLLHPDWDTYDVNWWYGSPVGGLGINDNAIDITWGPGPTVDAPARISYAPDVGLLRLENRTRTTDSGTATTIDIFRHPGSLDLWAEGTVALGSRERTQYFALPDPNLYFAAALRAALAARGVSVAGPTRSTTDSMAYRTMRDGTPLTRFPSRSRDDLLFPILNTSQNWFAEMLLKTLGGRFGSAGSWDEGLAVERRFLIDSIGVDSTAFSLSDGSGLSASNLVSPNGFARLLRYMWTHPERAGFLRALPRSGQRGSLRTRFVGTPLEGRVLAKTGSIRHVNSLSGYIEREKGGPLVFSIIANNHTAPGGQMLRQIDSIVVQMGR